MIESHDIDYLLKYNLWVVVKPFGVNKWQAKIYKRKRNKEWVETHKTTKKSPIAAYEWCVPIIFELVERKKKLKEKRNNFYNKRKRK